MSEIEKALAELKALMKYRADQLGYEEDFRGLGLTSRKNLCLHPSVKREKSGSVVDARCRSLTAGFVKEKKERGEEVDVCIYHDVFSTFQRCCASFAESYRIWTSWSPIILYHQEFSRLTGYLNTERIINNAHISRHEGWYEYHGSIATRYAAETNSYRCRFAT